MKLLSLPVLGALSLIISSTLFPVSAAPKEVSPADAKAAKLVKSERINLNTANAKELATLPGIGESRALRIINYREQNGKIKSLEQLSEIKGFGERSIAKLKGRVVF